MDLHSLRNPETTTWKKEIGKHSFPVNSVARYLGFSLTHTRLILNGNQTPNPETRQRLDELVKALKKEAAG